MKTISVIIPAYNAEKHIEKMIESLAKQSFKDFELIVVDDGSIDATKSIAAEAIKKYEIDGRVVPKKNGGQSSARNEGIRKATGKWLVMPDADDYLQRDYLKNLYDAVEKDGATVGFCDIHMVDDKNLSENLSHSNDCTIKNGKDFFIDFIKHDVKIGPVCLMIDIDFLRKHRIFFNEDMRYSEEFVFITELLYGSERAVHVKQKLYNYCVRPNSVSTSIDVPGLLKTYNALKEYERKYDSDNIYDKAFRQFALKRWTLASAHFCARVLNYDNYKKLMKKLNAGKEIRALINMKSVGSRTKMAAALFCLNMRLFYLIMKGF